MYSIMNEAYSKAANDDFKNFTYILKQNGKLFMNVPAVFAYD
jgi:hypothetical protein